MTLLGGHMTLYSKHHGLMRRDGDTAIRDISCQCQPIDDGALAEQSAVSSVDSELVIWRHSMDTASTLNVWIQRKLLNVCSWLDCNTR